MSRDWKEVLKKLRPAVSLNTARKHYAEGRYQDALSVLGKPTTKEERELALRCHYEALKEACTQTNQVRALEHAKLLLSLKPDRKIAVLTQKRHGLLRQPQPSREGAPYIRLEPGFIDVHDLGRIPVLGAYRTRGGPGTLNKEVGLLKKSPQEMDSQDEQERPLLVSLIAYHLYQILLRERIVHQLDFIVPIPADPVRGADRGFSAPEAIAKGLSAYSAIPVFTDVLRKVHTTRSLRDLDASERSAELEGSMLVEVSKQFLVNGSVILLVDDLVTYGTTFKTARKALLAAGVDVVKACAFGTSRGSYLAKY